MLLGVATICRIKYVSLWPVDLDRYHVGCECFKLSCGIRLEEILNIFRRLNSRNILDQTLHISTNCSLIELQWKSIIFLTLLVICSVFDHFKEFTIVFKHFLVGQGCLF